MESSFSLFSDVLDDVPNIWECEALKEKKLNLFFSLPSYERFKFWNGASHSFIKICGGMPNCGGMHLVATKDFYRFTINFKDINLCGDLIISMVHEIILLYKSKFFLLL